MAAKRNELTINLATFTDDYSEGFERTIPETIAFLQGLLSAVPEEFHDATRVSLGDDADWDRPRAELSIYYNRLETQEEADERVAAAARQHDEAAERARVHDLRVLAQLKAKYEK